MCKIFSKCYKNKGYVYGKIKDIFIINDTLNIFFLRIIKNEFCLCTLIDLSNLLLTLSELVDDDPEKLEDFINIDSITCLVKIVFIFDLCKNLEFTKKILGMETIVKIIIAKYKNVLKVY